MVDDARCIIKHIRERVELVVDLRSTIRTMVVGLGGSSIFYHTLHSGGVQRCHLRTHLRVPCIITINPESMKSQHNVDPLSSFPLLNLLAWERGTSANESSNSKDQILCGHHRTNSVSIEPLSKSLRIRFHI